MALFITQPPLYGNPFAQQHVYRPCHDSTAFLDVDWTGANADNSVPPPLPLVVLAAGNNSSNTNTGRGKKRPHESSSSSSNSANGAGHENNTPSGGAHNPGRGRPNRGPPRQRRRNGPPGNDDDDDDGNDNDNAPAEYVLDERALPCPFHLTDPAYYSRSRHERFSPCHTTHLYISTMLRHLSRAAHRLTVTDTYASSFGCRAEPGRPPQPQAGLCRRCWAVFRDEAAFDAHVRGSRQHVACVRVARPKQDKFWTVVETFCCAVPEASPAGVVKEVDDDDDDDDDTESPGTPSRTASAVPPATTTSDDDYVRRSELLAVQRRLDQLEACVKAIQAVVGTAPSAADDGFVLEDFVDTSQLPF